MKIPMTAVITVAGLLTVWPASAHGQDQAPPAAQTPAPVRVGGAIRPPMKTKHVNPIYPREAQAGRVQGIVILETVIGVDGTVRDAKVLRSVPLLDAAAVDAVRQWEFEPTQVNGVPVPVVMTVTVNFILAPPAESVGQPSTSQGMLVVQLQRRQDGSQLVWEIPAARANALAAWNSRSGEPPLSFVHAITTGEAWLVTQTPEIKAFELSSANLNRLQPFLLTGRWFYFLMYDPVVGGQRLPGGLFAAVVLMDGSVVEPRIEPSR